MTLNNLSRLFDQCEIVDTQMQIDKDYFATVNNIYSDGEFKTNITREGFIHINSVKNASYIIYVDRKYNICACIYKYALETIYKEIIDRLNALRDVVDKIKNNSNNYDEVIESVNTHIDDDVIDINSFICTECECKDKMEFHRSKTNPEALITVCNLCKTEYTFVPSKYYKLSSKKNIYFKSEKSSRSIKISESKEINKPAPNNKEVKK